MAAPTYISSGTASAVASGNMSPGAPAGSQADDIWLVQLDQGDNVSASITGYTQLPLTNGINNGAAHRFDLYWKRVAGGEAAPTVTRAAGDYGIAQIHCFRNCITTGNPHEDPTGQPGSGTTTVTLPQVTATNNESTVVGMAHFSDDDGTGFDAIANYTQPAGTYTETALGNDGAMGLFVRENVAAGNYGAHTTTATGAAAAGETPIGFHLVLIPVPAVTSYRTPRRQLIGQVSPQHLGIR